MSLGSEIRDRLAAGVDAVKVAPGRVNLIGEHTDYSSLPVLPMAIDRSIRITAKLSARPGLRIDSQRLGDPIEINETTHMVSLVGWHRYALAAFEVAGSVDGGAEMLIEGDLPSQGGLSSSSALTVAIIAALGELGGVACPADVLVAKAVEAERLTGVAGGEMDQNVIVHATRDHALRIGFAPLTIVQVPFPVDLAVIVAYSGTSAEKGAGVKAEYNSRVLGSAIAAAQLSSALGAPSSQTPLLADVAELDGVAEATAFLPEVASIDELEGLEAKHLLTGSRWDRSLVVPVRSCAEHVLAEAARVDQAVQCLLENDPSHLGRLFDASHASLQRFGASTPHLDRVVEAMRDAGACGARLTGAGFGGYAMALCTLDRVGAVVAAGGDAGGGPAFRVKASKGLA